MTMQDNLDELDRLLGDFESSTARDSEKLDQFAMGVMKANLQRRLVRGLMVQADLEYRAILGEVAQRLLPPPIPKPEPLRSQPIYTDRDMDQAFDDADQPRFLRPSQDDITHAVNGFRRTA